MYKLSLARQHLAPYQSALVFIWLSKEQGADLGGKVGGDPREHCATIAG